MPVRDRTFLAFAVLAVGLAIAAGLWATGGPGEQRARRYDEARVDELRKLAHALLCLTPVTRKHPLPEILTTSGISPSCKGLIFVDQDLLDDETGKPYRYQRVNDSSFRLCADFHDSETVAREILSAYDRYTTGGASLHTYMRFEKTGGCLITL